MRSSGTALDSSAMTDLDTQPHNLVKLASFYYQAVKAGKEDLRMLLRRGRGNKGGKTVVFERLFPYRTRCGYDFTGKPACDITILDQKQFDSYVKAMVNYLKDNPDTTHKTIDTEKDGFLTNLKPYGFTPSTKIAKTAIKKGGVPGVTTPSPAEPVTPVGGPNKGRKSIKKTPKYYRKGIPGPVDRLITECFSLDSMFFTNSKMAMSRVCFEGVLKYVVENTEYKAGKKLSDSNYFRNAYFKNGVRLTTTNFDRLKELFTQLILDTGTRKAFIDFELDRPHQIIHNYRVGALQADAVSICDNLMPLVEFMLQEDKDLIDQLDKNKL